MTQTPTSVCNLALSEVGSRVSITSLTQGTPAANAANLFYTPKTQMLLRGANWDFARKQELLTLNKAVIIDGEASDDPPPQPWLYEYLYPSDCLKMRFIIPYYPPATPGTPLTTGSTGALWPQDTITRIPFVIANDTDDEDEPIKVILTNLETAIGIYTADLSEYPDLWDPLFLTAETAMLGAYFVNTLARDKVQMDQQIAIAKGALDSARASNGNESISNADHVPDWMQVRASSGGGWGGAGSAGGYVLGYDGVSFPDGMFY